MWVGYVFALCCKENFGWMNFVTCLELLNNKFFWTSVLEQIMSLTPLLCTGRTMCNSKKFKEFYVRWAMFSPFVFKLIRFVLIELGQHNEKHAVYLQQFLLLSQLLPKCSEHNPPLNMCWFYTWNFCNHWTNQLQPADLVSFKVLIKECCDLPLLCPILKKISKYLFKTNTF